MISPAAALIVGRETALRADATLAAAMGGATRLYVEIPDNAPLPYVQHGEDVISVSGDDDCGHEAEVSAVVQWWTAARAGQANDKQAAARAIGAALVGVLLEPFAVAGWVIVEAELQAETYSTDPDRSTRGRLIVRYLLTQAAS